MGTFTLTIDTANAAFGEDDYTRTLEVVRILRTVADSLDTSAGVGALRDANGNTVGHYWWSDDEAVSA